MSIELPDLTRLVRPTGNLLHPAVVYQREEYEQLQKLLGSQYFLVRNGGNAAADTAGRCTGKMTGWRGCGRKHQYLTMFCIEQPFSWRRLGVFAMTRVTTPGRVESVKMWRDKIRAMHLDHPQTARAYAPDAPGEDLIAFALGATVHCDATMAVHLADQINTQGARGRKWAPFVP